MACDGYNNSALMGNWYEERRAFKQPMRMHRDEKSCRNDNDITFTTIDAVKPLARVARAHPWNTKGVIIDRGDKEFEPLSKYSYQKERLDHFYQKGDERPIIKTTALAKNTTREPQQQTKGAKQYPLINEKNTHQILEKRSYPENNTDFNSTLKKHPVSEGKFYGLTSYQSQNSRPKQTEALKAFVDLQTEKNRRAGVKTGQGSREGVKITSILTSEQYRDYPDPQHATHAQRAWVYGHENSLKVADDKLAKTFSTFDQQNKTAEGTLAKYQRDYAGLKGADNEASLPLECGQNSFFPKQPENGAYRHIRSDVTTVHNKAMNYR